MRRAFIWQLVLWSCGTQGSVSNVKILQNRRPLFFVKKLFTSWFLVTKLLLLKCGQKWSNLMEKVTRGPATAGEGSRAIFPPNVLVVRYTNKLQSICHLPENSATTSYNHFLAGIIRWLRSWWHGLVKLCAKVLLVSCQAQVCLEKFCQCFSKFGMALQARNLEAKNAIIEIVLRFSTKIFQSVVWPQSNSFLCINQIFLRSYIWWHKKCLFSGQSAFGQQQQTHGRGGVYYNHGTVFFSEDETEKRESRINDWKNTDNTVKFVTACCVTVARTRNQEVLYCRLPVALAHLAFFPLCVRISHEEPQHIPICVSFADSIAVASILFKL